MTVIIIVSSIAASFAVGYVIGKSSTKSPK